MTGYLNTSFKVYSIDLPGFGLSEVGVPPSVEELADIIHEFVVKLDITDPIMLGHSYGGRIAIVYAAKYQVNKLVLVSSAGLKQKLHFSKRLKIRIYKLFKKCNLPVKMGSTDYKNADNVKRIMLVKAVNQDLSCFMKQINCETLLLYGTKDNVTPLSEGYKIKTLIKNSYLIELEECGHFPYIERPNYFNLILMSYLVGANNAY